MSIASRLSVFRRPWGNLPLVLKGVIVVLIPVCGLVLTALLFARGFRQYKQAERWVTHTMDVRVALDAIQVQLLDAESGVRGYLLTGNREWLGAYERAQHELPGEVGKLRALVSDNEIAAARAAVLRDHVSDRLEVMSRLPAYAGTVMVPRGLLTQSQDGTDQIVSEIVLMRAAEDALLVTRRTAIDRLERRLIGTVGLTMLIGLGAGLGGVLVFTIGVARRVRRVGENAERLARGEPLKAPGVLRDEVGRLGRRLVDAGALLDARLADVRTAREELDRFFSLSLDLLCIASTNGHFLRVNPAWETTFGWTVAELKSRAYFDFIHPDDIEQTIAIVDQQMRDGQIVLDFENRYRCRDGSYRWLHWKSAPLIESGLMYGTARDVTAAREASRALETHATQLAALNRELEAFSYSVSHDLRSPLRAIDGFSQALIEDHAHQLDETGRGYLERVRKATQRMGALIDDLLNLARVARADLQVAPVDLSAIAEEVANDLSTRDPDRAVDWQIEPHLVADGDAKLLRIVLENLFNNAWKFTSKRDRARIAFSAERGGGTVAYAVRDDGAGFDMAYASKLFGTFQRLHLERDFPGNGVGLATVQRIIRRHGGVMSASGVVDGGATFTFTLAPTQKNRE